MQKMLVQLDVDKIERENKYDIAKMWGVIDRIFNEQQCVKEVNEDGSVMYSGNPNRDDHLCNFSIAYVALQQLQWFIENASKWIWYDNDYDEDGPFEESDTLSYVRKRGRL